MFRWWVLLAGWLCLGLPAWAKVPAAAAAPPAAAAASATGPLPVTAYFDKPALGVAGLSPAGRYLAVVRRNADSQDVVVYDQQTHESRSVYGLKGDDFRFDWLSWKGEDRLLIGVSRGYAAYLNGYTFAFHYGKFIVSVDRGGVKPVVMFQEDAQAASKAGTVASLLDVMASDPDHILAVAPNGPKMAVWKADVRTGSAVLVETGDSSTYGWEVDAQSNLVVRYRATNRTLSIDGRAPGASAWSEIVKLRRKDFKEMPELEFVGPAKGPGELYVFRAPKTPAEGQTRSLRIYDFKTRSFSDPVWPALKYEPVSIIRRAGDGELLGVCYVVDVKLCDFKDKDLTAGYRGLVKFFDGRANLTLVDTSRDFRWLLFDVSGPQEPSAYYLYDAAHKHVEALGSRFPDMPAARLARVDAFAYPARDGVQIPAYLTRPPGEAKGPLPLVVMPHGGPEMRDQISFDIYAQFLASHGYLVLQPNFRGSSGYGLDYAAAGHRQWEGRMQDDLTDGVKALVASGQADPARVCIVGASYGGYAALFGGASRPELYKCVVSVAGVSDLNAFMSWERKESGGTDDPRYQWWAGLLGDPAADRARLAKGSPISYAAAYGPPVLLFHGDADENVPVEQSRKMDAALRKAGRQVKLVIYKGEAHNGWSDEHEQATLNDIVAFLDQHIGPAAGR